MIRKYQDYVINRSLFPYMIELRQSVVQERANIYIYIYIYISGTVLCTQIQQLFLFITMIVFFWTGPVHFELLCGTAMRKRSDFRLDNVKSVLQSLVVHSYLSLAKHKR